MIILLLWCGFFVVLFAAAAMFCYRLLRGRSAWAAALVATAVFVLGALLLPIPIHGGFITPVAILWEELERERRHRQLDSERPIDPGLAAELKRRFAGALEFKVEAGQDGLTVISGADFGRAWYEPESRLAWSEPLTWPDAPEFPSLTAARDFCARVVPAGYWALPTEGELYFFWRAGGAAVSPNPGFSTMAQLLDLGSGLAMPTYHRGRRPGYALRCVARGPGAPESGYTSRDIALADWNEYQLGKAGAY